MIRQYSYVAALALVLLIVLVGCDLTFNPPNPTPPSEPIEITFTPDTAPTETRVSPTPSLTPSVTQPPRLEPPTNTPLPGTATATPTPTETPGPYEYTIQSGDTMYYIIQLAPWNYRTFDVINEILRLNPNITSIDRLPPPGSIIFIPRPTLAPTPEGFELTIAARPAGLQNIQPTGELIVTQIAVREGGTILEVAGVANTNLSVLATLNPEIRFFNCDFGNPSGGPDCNVPLLAGQLVNVPAPTPTPTLSPTFSGSETPTPTATYAPPRLVFPPDGAALTGGTFQLQWVSAGVLGANQVYLIEIEDQTTGTIFLDVTRSTSYMLPASLTPTDDRQHTLRWRVSVAIPNEVGEYRIIGGEAVWRTFLWRAR
jgi:hypothetical protein